MPKIMLAQIVKSLAENLRYLKLQFKYYVGVLLKGEGEVERKRLIENLVF